MQRLHVTGRWAGQLPGYDYKMIPQDYDVAGSRCDTTKKKQRAARTRSLLHYAVPGRGQCAEFLAQARAAGRLEVVPRKTRRHLRLANQRSLRKCKRRGGQPNEFLREAVALSEHWDNCARAWAHR